MTRVPQIVFVVVAWIALARIAEAQYLTAELRSLSSLVATAGAECELRLQGDRLDEVSELRFSHPGIVAEVAKSDPRPFSTEPVIRYGEFTVSVAADVAPGRYDVRAVGRHGVSNPRSFYVSPLPIGSLPAASHDLKTPTPISLGSAVYATTTDAAIDYYMIELPTMTRLRIELLAQRVDCKVIGQLQLLGLDGREIVATRGADQFDPSLLSDELDAGSYIVAVADFLYRGGPEFGYVLALQDASQAVSLAAEHSRAPESFAVQDQASSLPDLGQTSPQEPSSAAFAIDLPYSGTFWFPDDSSPVAFEWGHDEAKSWTIDVLSQRFGQPTDVRLSLKRLDASSAEAPQWVDVANVDDMQEISDGVLSLRSRDASLLFKATASSQYSVALRDLDIGRSLVRRQWFQLQVRQPNPGFDVAAYRPFPNRDPKTARPHGAKLARGGSAMIRVFVSRRDGWTGPVRVTIENLPAGLECPPIVLAANQSRGDLVVTAAEDASDLVTSLEVVATSDDQSLRTQGVPITLYQARDATRDFVLARLADSIDLAVSASDLAPLTLKLPSDSVIEVKQGQAVKLPLKAIRRAGGIAAATLRPVQLLPGSTCPDVVLAADASEAEMTLQTTANTPLDSYSFCIEAETQVKVAPNPQLLAREEARKASLEALLDQPDYANQQESIQAEIAESTKRIEAAQAAAQAQDLNIFLPSSTTTLRVLAP